MACCQIYGFFTLERCEVQQQSYTKLQQADAVQSLSSTEQLNELH